MSSRQKIPIPPDGSWGWIVLVGSFVSYFVADGWAYSFGIFFKPFLDNFEEGKGKTAIIAALLYGVPLVISPVICALTSAYGCRVVAVSGGLISGLSFIISCFAQSVNYLCVTLGTLCSIGLAMTYIPAIVMVTNYFEKYRGLATGLAVTGSGLGAFAFPPILEHLIGRYGWRGALLIFGGIYFHVCAAGALFRPPPMGYAPAEPSQNNCEQDVKAINDHTEERDDDQENIQLNADIPKDSLKSTPSTNKNKCCANFSSEIGSLVKSMMDKSLAANWSFLLFCASTFILYLFCGVPYVYLVDKATLNDISYEKASFLLSIIGIGRTVGQILLGILGDVPRINTIMLYAVCVIICGLDTLLIPHMTTYLAFCFYSAVFGFFISATYALQMMCIVEIVGLKKSTNAFGLFQLVQGIATLLGTAIPGWLYDKTENYSLSFYLSGALIMFSGFMLLVMPLMPQDRKKGEKTVEES